MTLHHINTTRMTIDFPSDKHKELKATAALMGMSMKQFILYCVLSGLKEELSIEALEEEKDRNAFDKGMKSLRKKGGLTLQEMKKRLGIR